MNFSCVSFMHYLACKFTVLFIVQVLFCFGWQYGSNHCDRSDIHLYYSRSMLSDPWAGLSPVPVSQH